MGSLELQNKICIFSKQNLHFAVSENRKFLALPKFALFNDQVKDELETVKLSFEQSDCVRP